MRRFKNFFIWFAIFLIILVTLSNLALTIAFNVYQNNTFNQQIVNLKTLINQTPQVIKGINGKDGYTPVKGIDYFDGKNGINGVNGQNGSNGTNGKDGKNGLTPEIKCDTNLNAWEFRYVGDTSWQLMNDKIVPCMGIPTNQ